MKLKVFALLAFAFFTVSLAAQPRIGFKTGWNSARILGESETDAAGNALESWSSVGGFHIGMTATQKFEFTDYFALRAELLFSKKGSKYRLESNAPGATLRYFPTPTGRALTYSNEVSHLVVINNSYLDVPLLALVKLGNFEFSAGVSAGLLIASYGEGSLTYSGYNAAPFGNVQTNRLQFLLDYNYNKDAPGGYDTDNATTIAARLGNQTINLPQTLGAYYDYPEDAGNRFNALDVSAIGGISYYLSRALYASVRVQYGLNDLSNNAADLSHTRLDASGNAVALARKDRNLVTQVSVGFSF